MSCKTCKENTCKCTKKSSPVMPPSECNTVNCPDPITCPEVISTECIVYTGDDKLCGADLVYSQNETLEQVNSNIVDYFCERITTAEGTFVQSVTGDGVDNTDPQNPVISMPAAGVESVTGTAVDNTDPLNPIINDPTVSNKVYVDVDNGNDSTGQFQNPSKPFATVTAAQAVLIANLTGDAGVIHFRPGTYTAMSITFTTLMTIDYYFELGCILDNPRFISATSTVTTSRISGYAKVIGTYASGSLIRLNSTGGSTLSAEFDDVNITVNGAAAVRTDSTGVPHNLTIKARRFVHTISNGLPIETFNTRGASNLNIDIDYLEFNSTLGSALDFRSSGATKGTVNANINIKHVVVNGADFTNIANMLPDSNLVYNCPKVVCNNLQNNIIRFDGEVGTVKMYVNATVSGTGFILWTRESLAITSLSNIFIDGIFVTNSLASIPVNIQSLATTHNIVFSGYIQNNTVDNNTIFLDDNSQLSLLNATVYHNPSNATDVIFIDTGATLKGINTQVYGNNSASAVEATALTNVMAQNFATNRPIGANIASLLVATPNFVIDSNFILPKIAN